VKFNDGRVWTETAKDEWGLGQVKLVSEGTLHSCYRAS
jgi:hypothetical protein